MSARYCALTVLALLFSAAPAPAQAPDPGGSADAATPTTLIENAQTRIVRVDIKPSATRSMHGHDDMQFHVFVTMNDPIVLTIRGAAEPVKLGPWQTHFFTGGTVHAITNPSPRVAQFLEFFTKKP
jgi:hypothetical protein